MSQISPHVTVETSAPLEDEIDLVKYLDVLLASRWLIAVITIVVASLGAAYVFLARPIYEADILIQVEDTPGDAKSLLGDVSSLFDVKTQAAAEIEILRSRMVVGKAVENLKLYIDAKPKYFPIFGEWIASRAEGLSQPGIFGFGGYSWGKESIKVSTFDVPEDLEGEPFTLLAIGGGAFRVSQSSLEKPIEGRVGKLIEVGQGPNSISLLVTELKAEPGAKFSLLRKSKLKAIERLQDQLKIAEKGKQSGIIGASLDGINRHQTAAILNEIGGEYVAQNIRRKSAEAEKSLVFLGELLPQLKQELETAELKYNEMRNKRGTFDLSEEGKAYLQESIAADTGLQELKQKRAEMLTRFRQDHPALQALDEQISVLSEKSGRIENQLRKLPNLEQDTLRLMRDARVNNDLYVGLLNNMQQLKLVKAGKVGNVRLIDVAATPEEPVKPKKILVIAIAIGLGIVLGIIIAMIKNMLFGGVSDAHDIERHSGLPVYATVPLSSSQSLLAEEIRLRKKSTHLLSVRHPDDLTVESLRSLRTALQFSTLDASNNRVLIAGPTPGVGKSFVSANLAAVMAAAGKRVLLVDADLRKGHLNQYFGKDRQPGLSDVLAGRIDLNAAIQGEVAENLDFLSTGTLPPNPAELLLTNRMTQFLDIFSARYDLVLIDSAPVLAVADAGVLAAQCGTVLLVTRFERSTIGEIIESKKQLRQGNSEVRGVIFNGLDPNAFKYGYGSKYGRYRYARYDYSGGQA